MSWGESLGAWLAGSALASLVVLAIGSGALLICRQPVRRLRIIELSLLGCLVVPWLGTIPGYPQWGFSLRPNGPRQPREALPPPSARLEVVPSVSQPEAMLQPVSNLLIPASVRPAEVPARAGYVASWLLGLYVLGVGLGIAWWLAGIALLARILARAQVASPRCQQLLAEIAGRRGARVLLLTSGHVKQPFTALGMAGRLLPYRPVIVLPANLCEDEQAVRWALAHEWAHLEHRDFRAWLVASLARVVFFYQPLVWWLRGQLRLCQDYRADAQASREASQPEDYAEFLTLQAAAGLLPPAIVGLRMGFHKSELYRRVVMLVQNRPLESRPPRLWSVLVTSVAIVLIGLLGTVTLAPRAVAEDAKKASEGGPQPTAASSAPAQADSGTPTKPTLETLGFTNFDTSCRIPYDPELDEIIKNKKYEFVESYEFPNVGTLHKYSLHYPHGRQVRTTFAVRLETVSSLKDYQEKEIQHWQQQRDHRNQAFAAGRFRLLNLEVMQMHLCRDVASGIDFKVQRLQYADGSEVAVTWADASGKIPVTETSWKEHLQAIRDGKRQLLKLETLQSYTYEMTADDGTKAILNYCGHTLPLDELLKHPPKPIPYRQGVMVTPPASPAQPGTNQ